mmetsp:Transcript_36159/g.75999  ORF Transcript_36159/g.75999 Transcript_36159/m.75999 type:complete len:83 (+) Transcript_36159:1217-1465(+)
MVQAQGKRAIIQMRKEISFMRVTVIAACKCCAIYLVGSKSLMTSIINTVWDDPTSSIAKGMFTCCKYPTKLMVLADSRGAEA